LDHDFDNPMTSVKVKGGCFKIRGRGKKQRHLQIIRLIENPELHPVAFDVSIFKMIVFHLLGLLQAERIFRSRQLNENSLICSFILGVKIFLLNVSLLSLHPGRISMQAVQVCQ
jgi:hypothetical protein